MFPPAPFCPHFNLRKRARPPPVDAREIKRSGNTRSRRTKKTIIRQLMKKEKREKRYAKRRRRRRRKGEK